MYRDRDYYYRILGLRTGASLDEVKAAYRRLVKLYHPDRNPSMDAEIMYREIRTAYEALLNSNIYKGTGAWTTQNHSPGAAQNSAPPRRAESSAGKKRETYYRDAWKRTDKTFEDWATGQRDYGKDTYRMPFKPENLRSIFRSSLDELKAGKIYWKAAAALVFVFVSCYAPNGSYTFYGTEPPMMIQPYSKLAALFYPASWIFFVYFRYYFFPSAWAFNTKIAAGALYGAILAVLAACFYAVTKTEVLWTVFWAAMSALVLMKGQAELHAHYD